MNAPRLCNNAFHARGVLLDLIRIGIENPGPDEWGCPVDHLLHNVVLYPSRVDDLCEQMLDLTIEHRINGSGLKLLGGVYTGLRIGGDQAAYYPGFVQKANAYLQEQGLQRTGE